MNELLVIVLAYLIGSIPTSVWVSRYFFGIDIREYGSGNAGATNTFRVLGPKWGTVVMVVEGEEGVVEEVVVDVNAAVVRVEEEEEDEEADEEDAATTVEVVGVTELADVPPFAVLVTARLVVDTAAREVVFDEAALITSRRRRK